MLQNTKWLENYVMSAVLDKWRHVNATLRHLSMTKWHRQHDVFDIKLFLQLYSSKYIIILQQILVTIYRHYLMISSQKHNDVIWTTGKLHNVVIVSVTFWQQDNAIGITVKWRHSSVALRHLSRTQWHHQHDVFVIIKCSIPCYMRVNTSYK